MTGVRVETAGAIATVTLDRPERRNALSAAVMEAVIEALASLDAREEVRVAVLRGAGEGFSAGFDVRQPRGEGDAAAQVEAIRRGSDLGRRMLDAVEHARVVTVASVHGFAVGGGFLLAGACDLRLAAAGTRFRLPEVELGIPVAWGGPARLLRDLPPAVVRELVLTSRWADAAELERRGFLNEVVAGDALDARAHELAARLAAQPALAVDQSKRQIRQALEAPGGAPGLHDGDAVAAALAAGYERILGGPDRG